ncbi:hypothetical protein MIND_00582000 [Mycena indigotica]|uniref:Uncharacterized protein n=1 Tax=Mycena indigotica TaxID=2126181 RepID=A0A8H6W6L0_9AGAR|nr:uncharacterized protein MIND_00582000 [Mycena indigotica]KAF7303528.1 hypothetical protein MIND_00582000 [Mycena indigotica]
MLASGVSVFESLETSTDYPWRLAAPLQELLIHVADIKLTPSLLALFQSSKWLWAARKQILSEHMKEYFLQPATRKWIVDWVLSLDKPGFIRLVKEAGMGFHDLMGTMLQMDFSLPSEYISCYADALATSYCFTSKYLRNEVLKFFCCSVQGADILATTIFWYGLRDDELDVAFVSAMQLLQRNSSIPQCLARRPLKADIWFNHDMILIGVS